jgi:hypothetical protein
VCGSWDSPPRSEKHIIAGEWQVGLEPLAEAHSLLCLDRPAKPSLEILYFYSNRSLSGGLRLTSVGPSVSSVRRTSYARHQEDGR